MKFEKLKNIVDVKKGKKPSFVEAPDENSVRVLQIDDLRNDTNPKFTNDKTGVLAKEDDVLIAWDGANAGTIGYGKSGYIGSTIALLRKKQPDLYSTTFIGIFLQSQYQYLRSKTTGATIPHISRKALDDLEVPVISVNDQLHIAKLLSKAAYLITQRKESIRLLDEYLKSTFLEMFGDPVRNEKGWESDILDNGCRRINVGFVGTCEKYYTDDSGIPLIRTGNLTDTFVDWKNLKYVTEEFHSANKKSQVIEGDILIARHGDNGKATLYKGEKGTINTLNIVVASPNIFVYNGYFLIYLLNNNSVRNLISSKTGGSTQKVVNTKTLQRLGLIVPPIKLQTQFAQIVEKTEALKTQYKQSLRELENLYGSLSQKAFRGELEMKRKTEPH